MKPHEKLGVAIADAGYAWTPEMRSAWEELDKQINSLESEIVMYRTDAEKLTMRLIDIAVSAPVKELTDEEWKLLEKVINDCADTIEYRIDVERLAFKGYEHCSELESLYEEQKDASRAKAILRKAQEK